MSTSVHALDKLEKSSSSDSAQKRKWYDPRPGFHQSLSRVLPEPLILLLYAFLIGIVGGYGAVGFRKLISVFQTLFFTHLAHEFTWMGQADVLLLPLIGLLIVSIVVKLFAPEAKGHGVPEVMAAIAEKGGIIRPRVVLIKAFASALCIGSGGSVGREGPIVQIGSAFGSSLGQYLGLPEKHLRLLIACGAGAGIAATFNAPIGGVMFATEVILGSFALRNFTAIVISSVVSAAIGRMYLGDNPSFQTPIYHVGHFSVFWVYVVLGILTGLWGFVYIRVLYKIEDWFDFLRWPFWTKAIFGGGLVGLIGVWLPQVFGTGYESVNQALTNHLALFLLVALLVFKLLATSITIAAGGSGGVFAPGLYQGSMFGGAIGAILYLIFPHLDISPGALAAMGMAGVFAGSAQAPVTSIIMLFEMTGDYNIILPLMITSVIAATVTSTLSRDSIYTLKLTRRGLDIYRLRQQDRMQAVCVGEAIAKERLSFEGTITVLEAWKIFSETKQWFAWVRDANGVLLGSVARAQVLEALNQDRADERVDSLIPEKVYRIEEKATLSHALEEMDRHDVTYLLVCRQGQPIGVIGSSDIVHAYKRME